MFLAVGEHSPEEIVNFFGYALGLSLERYNMPFLAGCQLFSHYHLDTIDVHAERPNFKCSLNGNVARALNAKRGRFDTFWKGGGSCDTVQSSDEETLNDIVYTEVNPVEAGLVKWAELWPAFTSAGWRFGETRTFKRPEWYFDQDDAVNPPEVQITRTRPPIYPELSDDELFDLLQEKVREACIEKQKQMREENRRFMGVKKVLKTFWKASAKSEQDRFTIKPQVVASTSETRKKLLAWLREWKREYAAAHAELGAGRDPLFPYGTYWLRVHVGVRVAQAPP